MRERNNGKTTQTLKTAGDDITKVDYEVKVIYSKVVVARAENSK